MPDNDTETPQPESTPAPPATTFVPSDDFKTYQASINGTLSEIAEGLKALRTAVAQRPDAPQPQEPRISDEQYDEAVRTGDGRILRLYQQQLVNDLRRTAIDPLQQSGQAAISELARKQAFTGKPYAERFKREIEDKLASLDPALRMNPLVYDNVYNVVVGAHADELIAEGKEAALRGASEKPPVPPPSDRRASPTEDDLTIENILGADVAETLRSMGRQPDEWARRMGYADMKAYLKVAQEQETPGGR